MTCAYCEEESEVLVKCCTQHGRLVCVGCQEGSSYAHDHPSKWRKPKVGGRKP